MEDHAKKKTQSIINGEYFTSSLQQTYSQDSMDSTSVSSLLRSCHKNPSRDHISDTTDCSSGLTTPEVADKDDLHPVNCIHVEIDITRSGSTLDEISTSSSLSPTSYNNHKSLRGKLTRDICRDDQSNTVYGANNTALHSTSTKSFSRKTKFLTSAVGHRFRSKKSFSQKHLGCNKTDDLDTVSCASLSALSCSSTPTTMTISSSQSGRARSRSPKIANSFRSFLTRRSRSRSKGRIIESDLEGDTVDDNTCSFDDTSSMLSMNSISSYGSMTATSVSLSNYSNASSSYIPSLKDRSISTDCKTANSTGAFSSTRKITSKDGEDLLKKMKLLSEKSSEISNSKLKKIKKKLRKLEEINSEHKRRLLRLSTRSMDDDSSTSRNVSSVAKKSFRRLRSRTTLHLSSKDSRNLKSKTDSHPLEIPRASVTALIRKLKLDHKASDALRQLHEEEKNPVNSTKVRTGGEILRYRSIHGVAVPDYRDYVQCALDSFRKTLRVPDKNFEKVKTSVVLNTK